MSFPSFANPSPGEFLRDARGNPLPDESLLVLKHIDRLERENAALRADAERYRYIKNSETMEVSEILQSFCVSITFDLDAAIDAARKEAKP